VGADGLPRFYHLMRTMRLHRPHDTALMFFAFDLLHQDGAWTCSICLCQRDLDRLCYKRLDWRALAVCAAKSRFDDSREGAR